VRDLIEALRRQAVPTCVASSGSHRKMDLTLGLTGLHAARSMGVEPNRCVVIEDPASAG